MRKAHQRHTCQIGKAATPVGMAVGVAHPVVHCIDPLVRLWPLLSFRLERPCAKFHAQVDHTERLGLLQRVDDALRVPKAEAAILAVVEGHLRLLEIGVLQILAIPHLGDRVTRQMQARRSEEPLEAEHECGTVIVAGPVRL